MGATSIAMLSGIIMGNNLDFVIVSLFQSSAAVFAVRRLRTRGQIFTAIFVLSLASILVVLAMGLFKAHAWPKVGEDILYLLGISILSPIITYGLIGLLEIGFDITTDLTLLELSDFNHPLLKRLQQEANGTFNHSVVVGNLAESCANAIDARSLLSRVGAYYHDIGKMLRPEYFIENQFQGENKHDTLTPVMSAKIIRTHVRDGLDLAEEYGLPQVVSDFIPMHHGNMRIEYFYHKALEEAVDSKEVDESAYRYPGPKPNTKETGIIMICEAVEAAVRSLKKPDLFKVQDIIDKIVDRRISDGQLDECPLTMDELRRIKGEVNGTTGMLPVIRGIYHIRIEYPEDQPEAA
ncbi:MAG: HDIG domain-containing metalloprotein, partial [Candidatus Neomarinimicrobiota bacterium]